MLSQLLFKDEPIQQPKIKIFRHSDGISNKKTSVAVIVSGFLILENYELNSIF